MGRSRSSSTVPTRTRYPSFPCAADSRCPRLHPTSHPVLTHVYRRDAHQRHESQGKRIISASIPRADSLPTATPTSRYNHHSLGTTRVGRFASRVRRQADEPIERCQPCIHGSCHQRLGYSTRLRVQRKRTAPRRRSGTIKQSHWHIRQQLS
ncbi:hypothetical protein OH77DRAFT_782425 [Trametes cingulata]|nr:hypothetical protein OH77DRAFT_782425 [Trametes cingulata]